MTQRRKIAIAYVFAVPVVLGIVLFQQIALVRVSGVEGEMSRAAEVLHETEATFSVLEEAEAAARRYVATGSDAYKHSYQGAVSRAQSALQDLHELTKSDPASQSQLRTLDPLVAKRFTLLQQVMDSRDQTGITAQQRTDLVLQEQNLMDQIEKLIAGVQTAQQVRMQQQKEAGAWSVRIAKVTNSFGGFLAVWLVGLAAFLLFHDEKARKWAGVERRVHTKVLETLPLGVCLTTETGLILYANSAEDALFGYEPGYLVGRNAKDLHDAGQAKQGQTLSEVFEHLDPLQVWSGELPIRLKDGTSRTTSAWVRNMEVPGQIYRVIIHNVSWPSAA